MLFGLVLFTCFLVVIAVWFCLSFALLIKGAV